MQTCVLKCNKDFKLLQIDYRRIQAQIEAGIYSFARKSMTVWQMCFNKPLLYLLQKVFQ